MPVYYSIYRGHGRSVLVDDLCDAERGEDDPFGIGPQVILERVAALEMTPVVDWPNSEPWYAPGVMHRVEEPEGTFLVTIGRDAAIIVVQEERSSDDPYEECE